MTSWIPAVSDDWLAFAACIVTLGLSPLLLYLSSLIRSKSNRGVSASTPPEGQHQESPQPVKTNGTRAHPMLNGRRGGMRLVNEFAARRRWWRQPDG